MAINITNPPSGYDPTYVFSLIKAQLQLDGFAVVSLLPLEYAAWNGVSYENGVANSTMVQNLGSLISMIQNAGLQ